MEAKMIDRYQAIRAKIDAAAKAAGRAPDSVRLVAVSKTHPFEKIAKLYAAGHRDFGENYVQELLEKAKLAREQGLEEIRWHFIGHLQTNKVKALLPDVAVIHGVGSFRLAQEISKRASALGRRMRVLIEVNIDDEESKSGARISELRDLAEGIAALPQLELAGLMCIPDPGRSGGPRESFRRLAALEAELRPLTHGELSMGMTSDFPDAIAEGATLVRVGTAIFGERDSSGTRI
jgi:pyridoxal phosphate enzyme (YggS family)